MKEPDMSDDATKLAEGVAGIVKICTDGVTEDLRRQLAAQSAEIERLRADCAAWRELVPIGCACCKWKDRNSDEAACAFCDSNYSKFEYAPNPGKPLLDRTAKLERAIEAMADGRLIVAYGSGGWWNNSGKNDGPYDTAADAALAGLDALEEGKEKHG